MGVTTPTSENLRFPGGGWHGITWQEWGEGVTPPDPGPDPVAAFTIDPEPSTVGDEVTFDATDSTPTPGITAYEWELVGASETGSGVVYRTTGLSEGANVIRLTVRLDDGRFDRSMQMANAAPVPEPDPIEPEPDPEPETRRARRGEP